MLAKMQALQNDEKRIQSAVMAQCSGEQLLESPVESLRKVDTKTLRIHCISEEAWLRSCQMRRVE